MRKTLLALLVCGVFFEACGSEKQATPADEDAGMQMAEQVSIFSSKDNQKRWLLQAEAVDFSGMEKATLKKPQLLLNENGEKSAQVSGDIGTFDYPKQLVSIEGNAKAVSYTEDVTLSAARFYYQIDTQRIWSDSRTTITRAGGKIVARAGIETDAKLSKIELKKQTTRVPKNTKNLKRGKTAL